jgi:hypothetical protein
MNEKEELERAVLEKFIAAYNDEHGEARLDLVSRGDAPDGVVRLGNVEIGIEVAHFYGTELDARNAHGRAGDFKSIREDGELWNEHVKNSTIPLEIRIPRAVNDILRSKSQERYGEATWLVIRYGTRGLWTKPDFEMNRELIHVPVHSFRQIWLMCGVESSHGILRLA